MGVHTWMRTYLRIDLDKIASNYRRIVKAVGPDAKIAAIVKANAYGHGATPVAQRLSTEGCSCFAVATLAEAVELREAGVDQQILMLYGFLGGEESEVVRHGITPVLTSLNQVEKWKSQGRERGAPLACHVKFNTGMNRAGLDDRNDKSIDAVSSPELVVEAVSTHLAAAEDFADSASAPPRQRFESVLDRLAQRGVRPAFRHMANSAGVAWRPSAIYNMVRTGLAIYGYLSRTTGPHGASAYNCEPAVEWRSQIVDLRDVSPGDRIGYNGTFKARSPMKVALLGVGYADGYRRALSNRGEVLIHGVRCPVVGRVSMDLTTVDATRVPQGKIGDEAVLLGDGITLHELADHCDTVSYEALCAISPRVTRLYS